MKKYFATFFVIALILALTLCGCSKKTENNQTEGTKTTGAQTETTQSVSTQTEATQSGGTQTQEPDTFVAPENYVSVVQVIINPTVNLYLDADELILAVEYVNGDAKTCYQKIETQLVGANVKDGVNTVIETANADGYLTENKTVTIDVVETKQADEKLDLLTATRESAKTFMEEKQIEAQVVLTEAAQKEVDDQAAAIEKDKKNPLKNLKTGVEYGLVKPGEVEELLTGIFFTFDANGGYKYGMAPYLCDEFGEGEFIIYNGKKYYVAGGGGGAGTYTMTEEKITLAGAYDMVFTMTVDGALVVEKADSSSDFFVVGDKLTIQE